MGKVSNLIAELEQSSDLKKKEFYPQFFKTGKGEYGEGDKFLGVTVVKIKKVISNYYDLSLKEIEGLLYNKFHEIRLAAIYILVKQYENSLKRSFTKTRAKKELRDKVIVDFYLKNLSQVNNWDLVDASAHKILGDYVVRNPLKMKLLARLARSKGLWENRIAVMATFALIKQNQFEKTIFLSKLFLSHPHDLIHKAVGWMLREVGKRDKAELLNFLQENRKKMPRVMLRYAIEKLPVRERKKLLQQ